MISTLAKIKNASLKKWLEGLIDLCEPSWIHICDGCEEEYQSLAQEMVDRDVFVRLNPDLRPDSFWCASDPSDVARVEERTFICSNKKSDAGPTNQWYDPDKMRLLLQDKFKGCMRGRKMYIVPFSMGPLHSPLSLLGIEVTDSPYVVCSMKIMTRMGKKVWDLIENGSSFIPCVHSVGFPLIDETPDPIWPCQEDKYIVHFPDTKEIWSYGSGYGGNALLGKKCLALRIASKKAQEEGWLAEHMLIIKVTNPEGTSKYFAAAFPSACGKTNLAMMTPNLPGWKVECVGDDIAWMRVVNGELRAINPEFGFFGVAPGTSMTTNPNAMKTITKNTIFTNVALTKEGDVWWEGMTKNPLPIEINWKRESWSPESKEKAAHPNSRFTTPIQQCPVLDPAYDDPKGVPISGIIFGGRRASTIPLVMESSSWNHGVLFGASLSSEMTAAAAGEIGKVRHDPFAMLPFCGYHMGKYFAHWIEVGQKLKHPPKIFEVNWFLKNDEGKYIWPGFGDNIRVIKWCFERIEGKISGQQTPLGIIPHEENLDLSDLTLSSKFQELFPVNKTVLKKEITELIDYFEIFRPDFPIELDHELERILKSL